MKTKLIIAFLSILTLILTTQAQDNPKEITKEKPETTVAKDDKKLTAKDYKEMLAKLKSGDTNIDYATFRLAYTETEDYSPYGGGSERNMMFKALNSKKYKDAIKAVNNMLKTNYCDLHSHYVATIAYKELGKTKESKFHEEVFKGLIDAITINDGSSAENAMISIGISEQYFIMNLLGFERKSKGLARENGSVFDVHTSYNKETKETRKFYFNIDKVFGRF